MTTIREALNKFVAEAAEGNRRSMTFLVMLAALIVYLLVTAVYVFTDVLSGRAGSDASAERPALLIPPLAGLLSIWLVSARVRFKRIRNIILKHSRYPHCGHDLRLLPTDPEDGATVCPECGCAWRLSNVQAIGEHGDG